MDHEISIWDPDRKDRKKDEGIDPPGVPGEKHHDLAGKRGERPRARPGFVPDKPGTEQNRAVPEREDVPAVAGRIPGAAEKVLGATPVGEGLLLRDGGERDGRNHPKLHRKPGKRRKG